MSPRCPIVFIMSDKTSVTNGTNLFSVKLPQVTRSMTPICQIKK